MARITLTLVSNPMKPQEEKPDLCEVYVNEGVGPEDKIVYIKLEDPIGRPRFRVWGLGFRVLGLG